MKDSQTMEQNLRDTLEGIKLRLDEIGVRL
jgi:hypothetical protein